MSFVQATMEELRQFLNNQDVMIGRASTGLTLEGAKYATTAGMLLEIGKEYRGIPRPEWAKQGMMKRCYMNTLELVRADRRRKQGSRGLEYVEGYAWSPNVVIPVPHAWATIGGEAIDVTWHTPEFTVYLGVQIPFEVVDYFERMYVDGVGILESGYLLDWPLLRRGEITMEDMLNGPGRRRRRTGRDHSWPLGRGASR